MSLLRIRVLQDLQIEVRLIDELIDGLSLLSGRGGPGHHIGALAHYVAFRGATSPTKATG